MKNKIQIITGKEESGKTFLAKNMALLFNDVFFIDGRNRLNGFSFKGLNEETDLIIVDDVASVHLFDLLFFFRTEYVELNAFAIDKIKMPKVIIITDSKINSLIDADSIKRKFTIIETSIDIDTKGNKIFKAEKIC